MKRSNIDAMICRQEKITDITRETINKIQLDKLNAVLKREKERQGFYCALREKYRGSFQNRQVEQPVQVNVYFIQKEIVNIP